MLNAYERSAVAESQEGIGVLVADNAPEQPIAESQKLTSAQMLVGVVQHNIANPENSIKLTPEQAQAIMTDLLTASTEDDAPTTADGRIITFNEMDDAQLTKRLSDYLGSGVSNNSINGALIEGAQDLMAEQSMSDEELEDLPNPKTAKGREMRERKFFDRMRDAAEELEKQLAINRDKWDKDTHNYGGEELTGAEIMERIDWFSKKENQDKVRKELVKKGKTEKEADEIIAKMKERDELVKRERDGIPPLTAVEKARLNALTKDRDVIEGTSSLGEKFKAERENNVVKEYKQEVVSDSMADQYELSQKRQTTSLTVEEQVRLRKYDTDTKLQATNALIDQAHSSVSIQGKSSEAYETFSSAPHVKEAFVSASIKPIQDNNQPAAVKPSSEQTVERPIITAAKIDATANAFM